MDWLEGPRTPAHPVPTHHDSATTRWWRSRGLTHPPDFTRRGPGWARLSPSPTFESHQGAPVCFCVASKTSPRSSRPHGCSISRAGHPDFHLGPPPRHLPVPPGASLAPALPEPGPPTPPVSARPTRQPRRPRPLNTRPLRTERVLTAALTLPLGPEPRLSLGRELLHGGATFSISLLSPMPQTTMSSSALRGPQNPRPRGPNHTARRPCPWSEPRSRQRPTPNRAADQGVQEDTRPTSERQFVRLALRLGRDPALG